MNCFSRANFLVSMGSLVLSGTLFCTSAQAGGLFSVKTLDPSYCKLNSSRQTVVYIDDTDQVSDQVREAEALYDKLAGSLMPGERTSVVELSPGNGRSKEIWTGCWPGLTESEKAHASGGYHLFSSDPNKVLKKQKMFFEEAFGGALGTIWRDKHKLESDENGNIKKSIIRSIESDSSRYSNISAKARVIIYSDMMENSDLGSVFSSSLDNKNYGTDLGVDLHHSVIYAYGLGGNTNISGKVSDNIRKFWTPAFRSMEASVAGMGSDLNIPNKIPVIYRGYSVNFTVDDKTYSGFLALFADPDGHLVDSWIDMDNFPNSPVLFKSDSTWSCEAAGKNCELSATTMEAIVTSVREEEVHLKSSGDSGSLSGNLVVPVGNKMFPMSAKLIAHN